MRLLFAELMSEGEGSEVVLIPENDISKDLTYEEADAVARHYYPDVVGVFYFDVPEYLQGAMCIIGTRDGAVVDLICRLMSTTLKYVIAGRRAWKD